MIEESAWNIYTIDLNFSRRSRREYHPHFMAIKSQVNWSNVTNVLSIMIHAISQWVLIVTTHHLKSNSFNYGEAIIVTNVLELETLEIMTITCDVSSLVKHWSCNTQCEMERKSPTQQSVLIAYTHCPLEISIPTCSQALCMHYTSWPSHKTG